MASGEELVTSDGTETGAMETPVRLARIDSLQAKARDYVEEKAKADSLKYGEAPWYIQLIRNGFHIKDPAIKYPKFPKFCLKVYEWGDRTFNSYDTTYVVGVGSNWKAMLNSYNWMESYMMFFGPNRTIHMHSDLYNDLGAYVSFMAVKVGYMAKVDNFFGHGKNMRKNAQLSFNCSLFSASLDYTHTEGGTNITHFGGYNDGKHFSYKFEDVSMRTLSGDLYYFFNHMRYSQAAAYAFSKYQLKSAGSWIAGVAFNSQTIDMDFSHLPPDMKLFLPSLHSHYRFRYTDYALLGGYAHNWVLYPRRWLINLSVLPAIGYKYSYRDSSEGKRDMFATNLKVRTSVVYNHRSLFASLQGRFDGNLYYNNDYTFFNSIESLSLIVGVRF
ncbi:MAG: DUF4421 domain-containing protein [Muribaculaceae bacterium]|nr:DUF4421 domain-containing protein [Muribaculaceae bacterium]